MDHRSCIFMIPLGEGKNASKFAIRIHRIDEWRTTHQRINTYTLLNDVICNALAMLLFVSLIT